MALIRHIGLVVDDLELSIDFWCNIMNFKIKKRVNEFGDHLDKMIGLKNINVETVKLFDSSGNILELLKFHSHHDPKIMIKKPYSIGLTHIALTVNNLDKTLQMLINSNYFFETKPQVSPDGIVKVIYAKGPEGVILELVEEIRHG